MSAGLQCVQEYLLSEFVLGCALLCSSASGSGPHAHWFAMCSGIFVGVCARVCFALLQCEWFWPACSLVCHVLGDICCWSLATALRPILLSLSHLLCPSMHGYENMWNHAV
jgi:hypothetical protein